MPQKCLRFHGVHLVGESQTKTKTFMDPGRPRPFSIYIFDETLDCEQVGHLKRLESRLFGFTYTEVRQLAYQLAEKNGIERGLNRKK